MKYRHLLPFSLRSIPLWGTFVLLQFLDAVVYPLLHRPMKHFYPAMYLVGCLMNLIVLGWLWSLYTLLPYRTRIAAAVGVSLLLAGLETANILVYREMGEYLSMHMMSFVGADPHYLLNFATDYLLNINILWFAGLFAGLLALWYPHSGSVRSRRGFIASIAGTILLPLLYLVPLNHVNVHGRQAILTTTAATGLAVRDYIRFAETPAELCASRHLEVYSSPATRNRDWNIIVIVNESWGRHGLPCYGSRDTAMPFLTRWMASDSARFIVFSRAYTNSSATNVSVPSLMTGVGPEESSKKLHIMPFLWDWARAADMSTLLVSAQRFGLARFDRFFFSPGPDLRLTAEDMDMPQVNDTGVDELYASDRFCRLLGELPRDRRFFAVYNSNAMHMPFQQSSEYSSEQPPFAQPYYNAAWLLDKSFRRICETLRERGELDRTMIIFTSDHSEYSGTCHECTPRISAFNHTILTIPFLVYIPASWPATRPDAVAALRANSTQPVANLDIAPTLVDVLGLARHEDNRAIVMEFKGSPLTAPVPRERTILSLNTNDIRRWEHEGFSLYTARYHFSFSSFTGAEYFDLATDPGETTNVWHTLPAHARAEIVRTIERTPHLKRIYTTAVPVVQ